MPRHYYVSSLLPLLLTILLLKILMRLPLVTLLPL